MVVSRFLSARTPIRLGADEHGDLSRLLRRHVDAIVRQHLGGAALSPSAERVRGGITTSPLALYGLASPLALGRLAFAAVADEAKAIRQLVGNIIHKVH